LTSGADRDATRWLWRVLLGIGAGSLIAAAVLFVLVLTGMLGTGYGGPGEPTPYGPGLRADSTPLPTLTAPTPSDAPIAKLVISRFGIAAPVQVKGVDAGNIMESPDGPTNVAWYDFSSKPGRAGNAVFSGHVDYINYGEAVFWHLKDLVAGDTIEVHLQDGTLYKYAVETLTSVQADPTEDQLRDIIGPSTNDIITLITCGGTFSQETHQYDHRTVVRAKRIVAPAAATAS
jgi:LPXTG-site transpeptidase (sortase) family protein